MYRSDMEHLQQIERMRVPLPDDMTMRLQRLEKPEPWPADLAHALAAPESVMRLYPNLPPFYERLAAFYGVQPDQLVLGSGSEDLVRALFWLCTEPGDAVAITWPTCAMFDLYAEDIFRCNLKRIIPGPRNYMTAEQLIAELQENLKLLILPNPGQPVETYFDMPELIQIAQWCAERNALFVIDEAYHGFGAGTAIPLIQGYSNVIVLRTFSKVFGLAGIRLGCAIGQASTIKPLEASRLSSEISGPAIHAATVMLNHFSTHVVPWSESVIEGREWLKDKLLWKLFVRGAWANHLLIEFNTIEQADQKAAHLKEQGIYIKSNFPKPLDRCHLITCGSLDYMKAFYQAWLYDRENI